MSKRHLAVAAIALAALSPLGAAADPAATPAPSAAPSAAPAASPAAAPAVATEFQVGAAHVFKSGAGARAVVLLPGLASGAYVFDGVVPELAQRYTVYAVTFAGFDGEPPVAAPYLDAFDKSIVDLIARERLEKPVVVGHSLGGHIALRLAEELGDSLGGVLVVDGLPVFPPPQPGETPESRRAAAARFRDGFTAAPLDQYTQYVRDFIGFLVIDPRNAALLATRSLRSDRATYGGAAYEYFLEDLRPDLKKISAPVELVVPAPSDAAGPNVASAYKALCPGIPKLDIVTIAPSRHFIMYDQPDKFRSTLDAFLDGVAAP